ncbi:MAG: SCO family protein [Candidatus Cohnella colombiensis]|uniref:SCO family protein n=1 Tax=Candidatus Cohnella colombiensis TaxID=3121368 RepID=A0AA95JEN0_9BACL|nr:MAG: SCO family protein [Cohnella sp.]
MTNEGSNIEQDSTQASNQESNKPKRSFIQRYGFPIVVLALCMGLGIYLLTSQSQASDLKDFGAGEPFSFVDTEGNTVSLENTNGDVRLLYFFFANCPDVCPPTTAVLSNVQDELKADGVFGNKVKFLSVTIDPTRDTTEVLKDYADTFDADPAGWSFLRGDEEATAELAKKYQVWVGKDAEGNFGHMNLIVLLDKKGHIRQWISAADYIDPDVEKLTARNMADIIKSLT